MEAKRREAANSEVIGMGSGLDLVYNDIQTKLPPKVVDSVLKELKTLQSNGCWSQIQERIGSGREGFVYHATDPSHKELAIKVFTVPLNEKPWRFDFPCRESMFLGFEFAERPLSEYYTYYEMECYGIRCPSPVEYGRHVVIAKFIGECGVPAPTLSVASAQFFGPRFLDCCIELSMIRIMRTLCQMGESVHGDLSENNVLYHQTSNIFVPLHSFTMTAAEFCVALLDFLKKMKFFEAHDILVMPAHVLYRLVSDLSITDELFDSCVKEIVLDTGARGLWIKQIEGMEKNTVLPEYNESVIRELKKELELIIAAMDGSGCYGEGYKLEYQKGCNASGASSPEKLSQQRGREE